MAEPHSRTDHGRGRISVERAGRRQRHVVSGRSKDETGRRDVTVPVSTFSHSVLSPSSKCCISLLHAVSQRYQGRVAVSSMMPHKSDCCEVTQWESLAAQRCSTKRARGRDVDARPFVGVCVSYDSFRRGTVTPPNSPPYLSWLCLMGRERRASQPRPSLDQLLYWPQK